LQDEPTRPSLPPTLPFFPSTATPRPNASRACHAQHTLFGGPISCCFRDGRFLFARRRGVGQEDFLGGGDGV
jgi:hypothetical protein